MRDCPHEYHEREASVYADGRCPICMRAEIERLRAELAFYKQNYARKQLTDSERRALEEKG